MIISFLGFEVLYVVSVFIKFKIIFLAFLKII